MSFSIWALAISAMPLQGAHGQTAKLSTATSLDLLVPSNASFQDLDASSLNIRCDGAKYGFNPSLADCEGARSYIAPESTQFTFGDRHTGLPEGTFPLPYMMMGGRLEEAKETSIKSFPDDNLCISDKAECYFQVINIGDGATGSASLNQIRTAASALFLQCGSNDPSQGGIVTNIGKIRPHSSLSRKCYLGIVIYQA